MNGSANPRMTFGQYLVRLLEAHGVDHVFGIPGVHNVELYRGLTPSGIRHVTPRHEQGAGFMADGYARVSGKPGVCFVITGPGLTNIITAMGQAYADSIPLLVISTCQPPGRIGSGDGHLHEAGDQGTIAAQVSAFSHRLTSLDEAPGVLARAFALFASARPRPVHIDVPTNLLSQDASRLPAPKSSAPPGPPAPRPQDIARATAVIAQAERPVILAGGGARWAGPALTRFAEQIDAPVCLTTNARGLLPKDHPLAISQSAALPAVRALIAASDLVIAIGTEIGPTDYDGCDDGGFALPAHAPLIRIDIDSQQIQRNAQPDLALVCGAAEALDALIAACPTTAKAGSGAARAQAARAEAIASLSPTYQGLCGLLHTIRDTLPEAILVGDSTQMTYAGLMSFAAATPGSWFNSATGYGTLGYALPAAIGARLASATVGEPRPVVVLAGDGGLQFSLAELGSAMEADCPLILLLWNNSGYGEIKTYMRDRQIDPVGVDIFTPDFAALASAYGWRTDRIGRPDALPSALRQAVESRRPTLVELSETEILPILLAQQGHARAR